MPYFTFFGATGGCTLAALVRALNAGIDIVALVRSSEKIHKLLSEKGVLEADISRHLTIIVGDTNDVASIKRALVRPNDPTQLTDVIISGLGSVPKSNGFNLTQPVTLHDPHICETAMRNILTGLRESQKAGAKGKPMIAVISTTGVSDQRDVPLAFLPLYHWLLAVPHADKRAQEALLEKTSKEGVQSPIRGFVFIRPSLLVDGQALGAEKLRVGWEKVNDEGPGPAIGYTVTREDVGDWIFKELVKSEKREQWMSRTVTLTA